MTELGWVHTVFAGVAIAVGGVVGMLPKGTRWHRTFGHMYVTAMLGVIVTAFAIYELTGRWGVFHWAAVIGAVTLAFGMTYPLLRRPRRRWIEHHAHWMSWSYIGLLCAFSAESLTRFVMPLARDVLTRNALWPAFWGSVAFASSATAGVGWWIVKTRLPATIASVPDVMRRERERVAADPEDRAAAGA